VEDKNKGIEDDEEIDLNEIHENEGIEDIVQKINLEEEEKIAREDDITKRMALYVEPLDYEAPLILDEEAHLEMEKYLPCHKNFLVDNEDHGNFSFQRRQSFIGFK